MRRQLKAGVIFPLLVFLLGCSVVYRPGRGWERMHLIHPLDIFRERALRDCYVTEAGLFVLTDGTTDCPEQDKMDRVAACVLLVSGSDPNLLLGADLIMTRDSLLCAGAVARGCTLPDYRTAFVTDFGRWPVIGHELGHLLGHSHPSSLFDAPESIMWASLRRCGNAVW